MLGSGRIKCLVLAAMGLGMDGAWGTADSIVCLSLSQATLEEVTQADLLLHVLDASSAHVEEQHAAVLGVLRALGVSEARLATGVVEVWNKADLLPAVNADLVPPEESSSGAGHMQGLDVSNRNHGMNLWLLRVQAAGQTPWLPVALTVAESLGVCPCRVVPPDP